MLRSLVTTSLALVLAGSLGAQDRLPTKQLAGPIDEVRTGVMAPIAPIEAAIHSKSAMLPVDLEPSADGLWRWQGEIAVDGPTLKMMLFSGDESWQVDLRQPQSKSRVPAHQLAVDVQRSSLEVGNNAFDGDVYRLEGARPGTWEIAVAADAPIHRRGFLLVSSDSPHRLVSYKASHGQVLGDAVDFVTFGTTRTRDGAPLKADARMVETASLRVTSPDGVETVHALFDDGLHRDGEAGDGVFGGSFRPEAEGLYNAQVIARGVTRDGRPFVRTAEHVVPVIARRMALPLDVATARLVDDRRFAVSIAIDNGADAPEKYRVFAEVWGADAAGTMQPVSWIGGMSYVDDGRLNLGLDARWIGRSKARHDFELRNVRIEDPDTFITVAQVDRMALDTPALPPIARRVPKAIDREMLVGPRPAQAIEKAGGRLLLVHGYCSSNVWGPQAGQFSNESIFLDLDKNRSHDNFAVRIGTFGSAWSSFGVVAHSQGGAASLHLYTYYWSGLDNASGGRLIQSVGTPYQGTSLAGNAAVLGQIFGVGCGTNTDLTYSGASSWLSGIPSWARNAVNYYTTSFKDNWWSYDYCNIVTDLLLNDPDDGTTEKAKGQLSSGVNRGHKSGWCHTSGMADPAQTTDGSRNASMNSNAAN